MQQLTESQLPERDAAIVAALAENKTTLEVAKEFKVTVNTVRRVNRREKATRIYDLKLSDGTQIVPIAQIRSSKGFIHACKKAVREYGATFARLELPQWKLIAGDEGIELNRLDSY